jgi:hypothetical protein
LPITSRVRFLPPPSEEGTGSFAAPDEPAPAWQT